MLHRRMQYVQMLHILMGWPNFAFLPTTTHHHCDKARAADVCDSDYLLPG